MIGIIIPPGDIKKLVQKTAQHVALNGSQFERMILERQQHKIQFAFLQKQNPYRAYYDHMVGQFSRKIIQQAQITQEKIQIQQIKVQPQPDIKIKQQPIKTQNNQNLFLQRIFQQLEQPDKQQYTAEIPQKLNLGQCAIIQHTAQYVARNGKNFLAALSQRQKNNPQFQFLKSSSHNYKYFIALTEAYTAILALTSNDIDNMMKYAENPKNILEKCKKIFTYYSAKQQQSKGKKQQSQQKKQQNIDWNDFQLVDTIIFEAELNGNAKIQEGLKQIKFQKPNPSPYARNMEQKIINQPKKKQILQQCHACQKKILASQMTKHLKSCLRGKTTQDQNFQKSAGNQVDLRQHLEKISIRMPHIFGQQDQQIIRKQQDQEDKIIWDGQAPNINRTTASIAMTENQQRKIKQQILQGQKK